MSDLVVDGRGVRFLLEQLSETERESIENEFFDRDETFEELVATEELLVEAYCAGELPPATAARFEDVYLARGDRRRRVALVRALVHRAARGAEATPATLRRGRPRAALGAIAALLALAAIGATIAALRGPEASRALRAERDRLAATVERQEAEGRRREQRIGTLDRELEAGRLERSRLEEELVAARRASRVVTLLLAAGGTRGGEAAPLVEIDRGIVAVRVVATLSAPVDTPLRASLQTPDGAERWAADGLVARPGGGGATVDVALDPQPLTEGHQLLVLSTRAPEGGTTVVGEYAFRVVRPPGAVPAP